MSELSGWAALIPVLLVALTAGAANAEDCVPSAPDGYGKAGACTVEIDRDNPASPPALVVHAGTTFTDLPTSARVSR